MRKVYITGNNGFLARNLIKRINSQFSDKLFVATEGTEDLILTDNDEIDIVENPYEILKDWIERAKIDVIVHNAAIVGTDVVAINARKAVDVNVYGTYVIAQIASELSIPIIYIGTTVIYDTFLVNETKEAITEDTSIYPRTLYASSKYEGEMILNMYCRKSGYAILRPLFCYGGIGDMNSLIAKSVYNVVSSTNEEFKIFLDPNNMKDYMHAYDFVDAIAHSIINKSYLKLEDYNVSLNQPMKTSDIADLIDSTLCREISKYIKWEPDTDYLGYHIIDNLKFKKHHPEWNPSITLEQGIKMYYNDLVADVLVGEGNYNPLKHLQQIEKDDVDILKHYAKK